MKHIRLTIGGLMALVLFAAVGFGALRDPSDDWASGIFTLTVLMLATALLGATSRSGKAGVMWRGAAIFGGVYLGMAFGVVKDGIGSSFPPFITKTLIEVWQGGQERNVVASSPPLQLKLSSSSL